MSKPSTVHLTPKAVCDMGYPALLALSADELRRVAALLRAGEQCYHALRFYDDERHAMAAWERANG